MGGSGRHLFRFFVAGVGGNAEPAAGTVVSLSPADSHHAAHVLRMEAGGSCEIVFAEYPGLVWEAHVEEAGVPTRVSLVRPLPKTSVQRLRVALLQGLPSPVKVDDIVDKGTQVGIDEFLLAPAARSPSAAVAKAEARIERWSRIAGEAAKQSRQPAVPSVRIVAEGPAAAAALLAEGWLGVVLEPSAAGLNLEKWARGLREGEKALKVMLAVGPEGGWTGEEVARYSGAGLAVACLGRRILRSETAGPVAVAVVRCLSGDW